MGPGSMEQHLHFCPVHIQIQRNQRRQCLSDTMGCHMLRPERPGMEHPLPSARRFHPCFLPGQHRLHLQQWMGIRYSVPRQQFGRPEPQRLRNDIRRQHMVRSPGSHRRPQQCQRGVFQNRLLELLRPIGNTNIPG